MAKKVSLKPQTLAGEIREYCQANADAKQAGKYARFFTEGYDAWGLLDKQAPFWTEKKAEWLSRYAGLGVEGFLRAGALLLASGKYEEAGMAILMLSAQRSQIRQPHLEALGAWFEGITNWAHTDVLCGEVLGPILRSRQIAMTDLSPWLASGRKYQRRAVPVAMISLLKAARDVTPLLSFLAPLMVDEEKVVHQGVGWFLREAWKKESRPVEQFLLEWKERAPRLIYQYATEKMTPAQRSRYRRSGVK